MSSVTLAAAVKNSTSTFEHRGRFLNFQETFIDDGVDMLQALRVYAR
jgi:hypothetical protein